MLVKKNIETMFNEKLGEIDSRMSHKDDYLRERANMATKNIGELESKSFSRMDAKDQSLKETLEEIINEELGEIEGEVGKIKLELKRDCQWGTWSDWEPCTQKCDGGTQQRKRPLLIPARFGGQCPGSEYDTKQCNSQSCTTTTTTYSSVWNCGGICTFIYFWGSRNECNFLI